MDYPFGLTCMIASTLGSFFGTVILQKLVMKTGRYSILILVLVIVLALSTVTVPGYSAYEIYEDIKEGQSVFHFSSLCGN